jgi:2-polyprenyl-6-hydroxyphenyl methylase/3-demethylubiquinone-9 3-methyltransferase
MLQDKPLTMAHTQEVESGERFQFDRNWSMSLDSLSEEQIDRAEKRLKQMLNIESLRGKPFIGTGPGSGLFSLAARRLGVRVHSLDYDPYSFTSTVELRARCFPEDGERQVELGSVLDKAYLESLGQSEIVYSWGVLHHAGFMWQAMENTVPKVKPRGTPFIANYKGQGKRSHRLRSVNKTYNSLSKKLRFLVLWPTFLQLWWKRLLKDALAGRPLQSFRNYKALRGMSLWHDVVDWVGGYFFEVAKPEQIFNFYYQRGSYLVRITTQGSDLG